VPVPLLIKKLEIIIIREGGNNQKLILFKRGKDISGAPIIKGISQLPNPPITIGIVIKKIIIKAWIVTITLYSWLLLIIELIWLNSIRIRILREDPIIPDQIPNKKYKVPISLWLVEKIHFIDKMAEYRL